MSKPKAFCLREPGVRLIVLEITATRVLLFECFFNSRTSRAVHSLRTVFLLAPSLPPSDRDEQLSAFRSVRNAAVEVTMRDGMRDEEQSMGACVILAGCIVAEVIATSLLTKSEGFTSAYSSLS